MAIYVAGSFYLLFLTTDFELRKLNGRTESVSFYNASRKRQSLHSRKSIRDNLIALTSHSQINIIHKLERLRWLREAI